MGETHHSYCRIGFAKFLPTILVGKKYFSIMNISPGLIEAYEPFLVGLSKYRDSTYALPMFIIITIHTVSQMKALDLYTFLVYKKTIILPETQLS